MAVIRYSETDDNTVNYIATLALFCCVSCCVMFKFGRFKTNFNVSLGNKKKDKKNEVSTGVFITGAYRTNRDDSFTYNDNLDPPRKITPAPRPPLPPPIPPQIPTAPLRQSKSTSDLILEKNLPPNLRQAQSGISLDPRGAESDNRFRINQVDPNKNVKLDAQRRVEKQRLEEQKKLEKQRAAEQKKLEKQRLDEQKKREKLAQQEQAKQEKLRKEREKKKNKKPAPQRPLANPLAQSTSQAPSNPANRPTSTQYSTNTLDSSISKSSGPPPYSEVPKQGRTENENSNVSFGKPIETDAWEMVSQHRQNVNVNRPVSKAPPAKGQTTMDLHYTLGEDNDRNSEV